MNRFPFVRPERELVSAAPCAFAWSLCFRSWNNYAFRENYLLNLKFWFWFRCWTKEKREMVSIASVYGHIEVKISPHSSKQLMNLKSSKWNSQIAIRYFLWLIPYSSYAHVFKMYTHNWLCFSSLEYVHQLVHIPVREIIIAFTAAGWLLALGVLYTTNPI